MLILKNFISQYKNLFSWDSTRSTLADLQKWRPPAQVAFVDFVH